VDIIIKPTYLPNIDEF